MIALDLLGHGSTDGNDSDLLIEDYSEFLLSFMNALNIDKAHFFAFSSGAIIAMDFALAFPERVKKLLLITPGGMGDAYPAVIRNAGKPVISDFEFTFFNRGMIAKTLESAYFDKTMITDELVDEYFSQLSDPKISIPPCRPLHSGTIPMLWTTCTPLPMYIFSGANVINGIPWSSLRPLRTPSKMSTRHGAQRRAHDPRRKIPRNQP